MHAGEQLLEAERLDEVVVGPGLESLDPVPHLVPRGQHQDAQLVPRRPQPAADLEAIDPGQHDVEDDEVGKVLARLLEALLAGGRLDDAVPLVGQAAADDGPDLRVVVDDQDASRVAHRRIPRQCVIPGIGLMVGACVAPGSMVGEPPYGWTGLTVA